MMKLFYLLDNPEQRQVALIQLLSRNQQGISLQTIAEKLDANRTTIKEDIGRINVKFSELSSTLKLTVTESVVHFKRDTHTAANELYYAYLKDSTKYRILMYLFDHGKIDSITTSTYLNISLSTLERRIRELNRLLIDFHITLKSGKLVGSEIQIRHFFLQLIWFSYPYKLTETQFNTPKIEEIVHFFNQRQQPLLTTIGTKKLMIYLQTVETRRHLVSPRLPTERLKKLTFQSHLFQQIHNFFDNQPTFSHMHFSTNEQKLLYLFLISNFCFDTSHSQVRHNIMTDAKHCIPVWSLQQSIFNQIKIRLTPYKLTTDFFNQVEITLIQIHYRAVFMRGWIAIFGDQGIYDRLIFLPEVKFFSHCRALCQQVVDLLGLADNDATTLFSEISGRYAAIFQLAFQHINYQLRIGCNFGYEDTMAQIIINRLQQKIDARLNFKIMTYQKDQQYDIIISNFHQTYSMQTNYQEFVMLSPEYDTDFPELNRFLEQAYFNKLKSPSHYPMPR
ncbi:MAG TPA: helix-turn-helix domain-containing protein [Candidatus Levilactobacillus faecigallinarum]|uniref:Helix-turn-helix domain-containing protein n=1 Tax=Candidatus Levilactobacillus faecigallinarum TaxID=2838638 RepID=A0A9D1QSE2_9LACO|nr:helix-turn-helix domain-containing protein [Candidatus Levilactobacillus faecigallinarum]